MEETADAAPIWDVHRQIPLTANGNIYMRPFTPVKGQTIVCNGGLGMGKSMNGQRLFRPLLNRSLSKHLVLSVTSRIVQTEDEEARFMEDFSTKGDEAFQTDPLLRPGIDGFAKDTWAAAGKKVPVFY